MLKPKVGSGLRWDDIIGHKRQIQVLRAGLEARRTPHAYLFVGEPGVGKGSVADVYTRALTCNEPDAAERPCGRCTSCRVPLDRHPDVITVTPDGSSIRIDQVRAVQRRLLFRPDLGRSLVVRIDPADALTEQAQNALLKSLEEPPAYVTFILLSHHLHALLSTIRSRCVKLRFGRVKVQDIAEALVERGYDVERAKALAALSFGRPGSLAESDAEDVLARRQRIVEWGERLLTDRCAVWYVGEAVDKERDLAQDHIDMLILWLRDVLLVRTGRQEAVTNQDLLDRLRQSARNASPSGLTEAIEALMQLKEHWNANANFRLALDVALIKAQRGLRSA
jgi:DNA polymerase-3 subunit delta'